MKNGARVEELLMRVARQLHLDNPSRRFELCYLDAKADYNSGAISESFLDFLEKYPDSKIVMAYEDEA